LKDIIIVGASGFGRELLQYVRDTFKDVVDYRIKGFLDDDPDKREAVEQSCGIGVLGDTHAYPVQKDDRFLVSVGTPKLRQVLAERLASRGAQFLTLIHPAAYVAPTARLGVGCIVCPFASVGSFSQVSDHVLLNLYAAAGHDAEIGSYCVLSPYSVASGGSVLKAEIFVGTHATVVPCKRVGTKAKIAAGSVVYHDVPANALAMGNPAKTVPLSSSSENYNRH
jgi:sugar O-acyltransferase (sialic acid O-acetyltransferase NeuD family)